ncbi:hypothetical protein J1605_006230 [Eschrichtius robustus]|uniref:Uncharacterized protein n=1 Tax=Eschrichtius robustus TaxID=9764 RepID=A0AB34H495_ESCRO|nr:hypothetical protein J1605_006230 [Eschrichtius robustus]
MAEGSGSGEGPAEDALIPGPLSHSDTCCPGPASEAGPPPARPPARLGEVVPACSLGGHLRAPRPRRVRAARAPGRAPSQPAAPRHPSPPPAGSAEHCTHIRGWTSPESDGPRGPRSASQPDVTHAPCPSPGPARRGKWGARAGPGAARRRGARGAGGGAPVRAEGRSPPPPAASGGPRRARRAAPPPALGSARGGQGRGRQGSGCGVGPRAGWGRVFCGAAFSHVCSGETSPRVLALGPRPGHDCPGSG